MLKQNNKIKNSAMKRIVTISLSLFVLVSCHTTKKSVKPVEKPTTNVTGAAAPVTAPVLDPVKKLPSGLEYQVVKHGTSSRKPVLNDRLELNLIVSTDDSVIFDSHKMNKNKPIPIQVAKAKFQGDPIEGYMLLSEGDSAIFWLPVDTLLKSGTTLPPWMKPGKKVEYDVMMLSIKNDSEAKREMELKIAAQKELDDKLLQDYFLKNNLHPAKTASGLYYQIKKEGTGDLPKPGNVLSMFYLGRFLNGNIFDTNQDSTFHHQDALKVELGKGRVIKGWDEGLGYLRKGSVATLYIPSGLAYGPKDRGPIPGNSILLFDVTVSDIQTQEEIDTKVLQDYFTANKIKPLKTASGLYYSIKKKGKGPLPKEGQNVTVKYTGKTIDGTTFDSNVDTAFHHTDPFSFELGKGRVIRGWDEGIGLLNKGTVATLYIPSQMAYGSQGQGKKIPPNSVLVFDVELVEFK